MTVKLYVSYAANLIAVVLMLVQMVRLEKLSDDRSEIKKYFRRFSGLVFVMCIFHLVKSIIDIRFNVMPTKDLSVMTAAEVVEWYWPELAAAFVDTFFSTAFLYMWVSFMSWFLYEDKDFIRRRFWVGFAPLVISAAVSIISIPGAVMSESGFWFFICAVGVAFVVRVFYFLICLWLLDNYKKQNGYLRFFNPWAFFIPVAASWLIQDFFGWGVGCLGTALGIFLIFRCIVGEERYMDDATRFYKREVVGYLKKLVGKKKYAPESAMSFTLEDDGDMKEFSGILKKQLPADCEPILCNDKKVVVLTNVNKKAPLTMVIMDVKAEAEVQTACTLKKKTETTEEFMERVL